MPEVSVAKTAFAEVTEPETKRVAVQERKGSRLRRRDSRNKWKSPASNVIIAVVRVAGAKTVGVVG
jgi:hypothetical protein